MVQIWHHDNAFKINFSVHVYPGNLTCDLSIAIVMLYQFSCNHLIVHSVSLEYLFGLFHINMSSLHVGDKNSVLLNQCLRFLISYQQMHTKQAWFYSWTDKESKPIKSMTCQRALNNENWCCTRNFFQDRWLFHSQLPLISRFIHASKGWCTVCIYYSKFWIFFSPFLCLKQTPIPHIYIYRYSVKISAVNEFQMVHLKSRSRVSYVHVILVYTYFTLLH